MVRRPMVLLLALAGCAPPPAVEDPTPNWHRDVQPLVQARCGGCHAQGGAAPFALETYADAESRHALLADAVRTRRMPPWLPADGCQSYVGDRRLRQEEIDLLVAWSEAGAPEGTPRASTPEPAGAATLAWVDATVDPGVDYTPSSTRTDDYRCFLLDPQLTGARDVIGFEVEPGVRREVHHVLLYTVTRAEAAGLEDRTPGPGWQCFGGPGPDAPKMVGGWVPGTGAVKFPGQTGVTLYDGDVLLMQVHYNTASGPPAPDRTRVRLQYAANPVQYHAQMFPLVEKGFAIPPRSQGYAASAEFATPVPASVWGVIPHMHQLGRRVQVRVLPPAGQAGEETCLVDVPRWDFQWQQFYFFQSRTGLPVKQDARLRLDCTWDNPSDQTVRWGEGTGDEMCLAFVYVTGPVQ